MGELWVGRQGKGGQVGRYGTVCQGAGRPGGEVGAVQGPSADPRGGRQGARGTPGLEGHGALRWLSAEAGTRVTPQCETAAEEDQRHPNGVDGLGSI